MKPHKQTKKTAVRLKNRGKKKTKGNKDTKHSLLNLIYMWNGFFENQEPIK